MQVEPPAPPEPPPNNPLFLDEKYWEPAVPFSARIGQLYLLLVFAILLFALIPLIQRASYEPLTSLLPQLVTATATGLSIIVAFVALFARHKWSWHIAISVMWSHAALLAAGALHSPAVLGSAVLTRRVLVDLAFIAIIFCPMPLYLTAVPHVRRMFDERANHFARHRHR